MFLLRHGQSYFNLHFTESRIDPGIEDPELTELGLAQRSREGWDITPEGSAFLAGQPEPPANSDPTPI